MATISAKYRKAVHLSFSYIKRCSENGGEIETWEKLA